VSPAIVGCLGPASKDFCGIIKAHEQSFGIEIEDLLTAMGWDVRGKKDFEASPGLVVLLPGIYFLNFKTFMKKYEGY
jgi:hypothetical protein